MLWHVHVIVKGAKVSPPQTVQTVDLLLSGPLLHTSNQSVNTMRWPLHSDKPSVVLCPCCWLNYPVLSTKTTQSCY